MYKPVIKRQVPIYLCDNAYNLRIDGLLKLFIEASQIESHKAEKNVSLDRAFKWIVYKWHVDIFEDIKYEDLLEISTFTRKFNRFYAYRNFFAKKKDKLMARADSTFLILDEKGSIMRIPEDLIVAYGEKNQGSFTYDEKDLRETNYDRSLRIQIRRSDLDINGHVNNTNYLEFAMEAFENVEKYELESFDLIYKREIKYEEECVNMLYRYEDEDSYRFLHFAFKVGDQVKTLGRLRWRK